VRVHEGRFHQVRRMCEAVGLEVKSLHRYGYGPLVLGRLPRGAARGLTQVEVRRLKTTSARPGGTERPRAVAMPRAQAVVRSGGSRGKGTARPGRVGKTAWRPGYGGSDQRGRPARRGGPRARRPSR
jgi:23S rRNA pseudouridine2605 synthase